MQTTVEEISTDIAVLKPVGRLDLLSAAEAKARLADLVANGNRHLVLDLSGVEFIDSSGLGAVIGGLKAARLAGGDLRLAGAGEQAKTILKLTTLDRVLQPYDTVEEALAGYR